MKKLVAVKLGTNITAAAYLYDKDNIQYIELLWIAPGNPIRHMSAARFHNAYPFAVIESL